MIVIIVITTHPIIDLLIVFLNLNGSLYPANPANKAPIAIDPHIPAITPKNVTRLSALLAK